MTAHGSVGGIAHGQRELPSGLSPFEILLELERWIVRANSYADSRKNKFVSLRQWSSCSRSWSQPWPR
jgi:hypothetical protein